MRSSGFEVSRSEYIHRQTVNKKEGLEVPRTFVQGKYVKPTGSSLLSTQSTGNEAARDKMAQTLENETTGTSLQSTQSTRIEAARDNMAQTLENETTGTSLQSTQSTGNEAARDNMAQTLENETNGTSLQSTKSTGNEAARDNMAQTLENETNGTSLQSTKSTGNEAARDNMAQTLENETTGTSLQSTKSAGNKVASDKIATTNFENKTTDQEITQSAEKEIMKGEMTQTHENETSRDECIDCDRLREVEKSCKNTGGKKNCGAEVPDNMYANGDNASIAEETCICSEDKNNVTKDGDSLREFDKCVQENFEIPIHEHVKPKNSEAEILCEKYETDDISKISSLSIKNNCDLNERKVASGCDSMQDDS